MKRYALFVLANKLRHTVMFERSRECNGAIYFPSKVQESAGRDGTIPGEEHHVFFFDDVVTRDKMLEYLKQEYPGRTYMLLDAIKAVFNEPGEYRTGRFTDAGFLPE